MSTKSKEWQEFKRVREDILGEYTTSDAGAIRKKWAKECLQPLGYNHEFDMLRCKERSEEDKIALYAEWTQMFKDGKFSPEKKTTTKKTKPKRGASLDDLTLDDDKPEIRETVPLSTKEVPMETKEVPLETKCPPASEQCKQSEWEALPLEERAKRTIAKQSKPKPKEQQMEKPKSKKELLLEAINALEEEESAGITQEDVLRITTDVIKEVMCAVVDTATKRCDDILNDYTEEGK